MKLKGKGIEVVLLTDAVENAVETKEFVQDYGYDMFNTEGYAKLLDEASLQMDTLARKLEKASRRAAKQASVIRKLRDTDGYDD